MTPNQRQKFNIIKPIIRGIFEEKMDPWDPQTLNYTLGERSDFIRFQRYAIQEIDKKHNYDDIQLMELMYGNDGTLYIMYDAMLDGHITAMIQVEYKNFIFDGFSVWDETFDQDHANQDHIGEYK